MTAALELVAPSLPAAYYDDGRAVIYHADARAVLPYLTADVILTDLPYGVGLEYDGYDDTPAALEELVRDCLPAMREAAPVVAFTCGIANLWRYPPPTWVLAWYQVNALQATGRWGFNAWQPVLVYGADPYLKRGRGRRPDVIVTATGNDRGYVMRRQHPCPKPPPSWRPILGRVSPDVTDRVIDPFMGAGTTLVVAKAGGRHVIGVEQSERYCEVAARRLQQQQLDFGGAA